MSETYYITPSQYKVLETLCNEDASESDKQTRAYEIAAKKMHICRRTLEHHIQAIEFTCNTTNKFKITKLFLEGKLIPIDKGKEKSRWQNLRIPLRDL